MNIIVQVSAIQKPFTRLDAFPFSLFKLSIDQKLQSTSNINNRWEISVSIELVETSGKNTKAWPE